MINAGADRVRFGIHEGSIEDWLLVADTALDSPEDIAAPGAERPVTDSWYHVMPRSVVLLVRKASPGVAGGT